MSKKIKNLWVRDQYGPKRSEVQAFGITELERAISGSDLPGWVGGFNPPNNF